MNIFEWIQAQRSFQDKISGPLAAFESVNKLNRGFEQAFGPNLALRNALGRNHSTMRSLYGSRVNQYQALGGLANQMRGVSLKSLFNPSVFEELSKNLPPIEDEDFLYLDYDLNKLGVSEETSPIISLEEVKRVKSIIGDIYKDNNILYKIEPHEFEEVVAELLFYRNFEVELTKRTRDGGYDILALQKVSGIPFKLLVECKRYRSDRPVDIQIVRSFMDVIHEENANAGLIVTTSYFTQPVKERQAKKPYLLNLEDRIDVLDWVEKYIKK